MRLWHKLLLPYLPRQQLLGQWREVCLIAKSISEDGTPNHILVNRVLEYPISQFNVYAKAVYDEMIHRGFRCDWERYSKWQINKNYEWDLDEIFPEWHNDRYLKQCYYNLQEKYDCGGIPKEDFEKIEKEFGQLM